ncbi:secreted RxLR effector protein 161-like [Salvia miltiorrhiza]|uniref:secreted RxLR effector protein 161-like n=1 Tax=Salvia miltiorrhiza TaxID=226208 RepID=UPI0025AD7F0C|nr:secreted RxLR effector protein 161-like [Salvia miltiorrhiza]
MYAMQCTRPDICFAVGIVARYQANPGQAHWTAVKHILKYLKRTKEYALVYQSHDLTPVGYVDADYQGDKDKRRSTTGYVFMFGGGAIVWRSVKQKCNSLSTMEAEYVAACEAAKEAVWLRNFLAEIDVIPSLPKCITIYCDNEAAIMNTKDSRCHQSMKHIDGKYHYIRSVVKHGDVALLHIAGVDNLADPFTKSLPGAVFNKHVEDLGVRDLPILN